MNLTETHAGSDLSDIKTKAIKKDGNYCLKELNLYHAWRSRYER